MRTSNGNGGFTQRGRKGRGIKLRYQTEIQTLFFVISDDTEYEPVSLTL